MPDSNGANVMAKSYLEANEVESLERAATNLRDRLLIRLLFHLGCCVSEALGATVEDIDLIKSTVTIQHLKTHIKLSCPRCSVRLSKSHTYCPGCGVKVEQVVAEEKEHRRQRVLPVDSETLSALKDYIRRGGPVLLDGKRLVFDINRHRAWQIVKECAEKAGLPRLVNPETGRVHNISPSKLRDAFVVHAVKLNNSGDGPLVIKNYGGRKAHEHLGSAEGEGRWLNC